MRLSKNSAIIFEHGAVFPDRIDMAQPIASDFGQQFLFPPALEDCVPADHLARFLLRIVVQLSLLALGFAMPVAVEGRLHSAPGLLLKIWLYGHRNRIRATRRLEVACREHLLLLSGSPAWFNPITTLCDGSGATTRKHCPNLANASSSKMFPAHRRF